MTLRAALPPPRGRGPDVRLSDRDLGRDHPRPHVSGSRALSTAPGRPWPWPYASAFPASPGIAPRAPRARCGGVGAKFPVAPASLGSADGRPALREAVLPSAAERDLAGNREAAALAGRVLSEGRARAQGVSRGTFAAPPTRTALRARVTPSTRRATGRRQLRRRKKSIGRWHGPAPGPPSGPRRCAAATPAVPSPRYSTPAGPWPPPWRAACLDPAPQDFGRLPKACPPARAPLHSGAHRPAPPPAAPASLGSGPRAPRAAAAAAGQPPPPEPATPLSKKGSRLPRSPRRRARR